MEKTLRGIAQYARKNYLSYWIILGIDTVVSVLCSLVAYAVIHYMAHVPMSDWMLCQFVGVSLVASVAGAPQTRMRKYSSASRHAPGSGSVMLR